MSYRLKVILLFFVDLVITSFSNVFVWNSVVSELFNAPRITIAQGWLIGFAIIYFFGHKSDIKEEDYAKFIGDDIVRTVLIVILTWALCQFAF